MKVAKLIALSVPVLGLVACGGWDDDSSPNPLENAAKLKVSSPAFDSGVIAEKYSKYGQNVKPQIAIADVPSEAKTLAIVMDDETPPCGQKERACLHANVFNIPSDVVSISEGWAELTGSSITLGGVFDGNTGYAGPRPPIGQGAHTYKLSVYALNNSAPAIAESDTPMTRSQFEAKYGKYVLATETVSATYEKK